MSTWEIIFLAILADLGTSMLVLSLLDTVAGLSVYNPNSLHKQTEMNWFGCIFIYVFLHILFPFIYIIFDFNLLSHIRKK